jgi:adhesin transport system outer membrane protein
MKTISPYRNSFSALLIASFALTPSFLSADTLNEVVEKALKTNPEVLAQVNAQLAATEVVKQAEAGYKPTLDVEAGIGRERSRNPNTQSNLVNNKRGESSFTATQMLYDGFNTKYNVDRSQALAEVASYQIADTSQRIAFETAQAYMNVLRADELVAVAEDSLDTHVKVNDQIQRRVESGVSNQSNVDQAMGRVALANSNKVAADGNRTEALISYKRLVGEEPGELEPEKDCCQNLPENLKQAIDLALENHPALDKHIASHEASLAATGVADSSFHPTVNLEIEGSADNNLDGTEGHDKDLRAMLRLRQNLLNGGADTARVAETEHLAELEKSLAMQKQREIEKDVRLSWNSFKRSANQLPFLQQHAVSTEQSAEAYKQQFLLGQRTLLDLLDSEAELADARSSYINARYDYMVACYNLFASMGMLTDRLNIALPEQAIVEQ